MNTNQTSSNSLHPPVIAGASRVGSVGGFLMNMETNSDKPKAKRTPKKSAESATSNYKPYWEKLKDPRWQRKRLEIMERDKFACRHCRSTDNTLNVHHRIYGKGLAPWDYGDHILITLCEDCHNVAEAQKERVCLSLGKSKRQDENLALLAAAVDANPIEWTFWGWAAEHIAQCIRMHRNVKNDPNGDDALENFEEARTASFDAIKEIVGAMRALEKSYDE
jgi:5-methylcytosine-specific restriction endonuclease McrA